VGEQEGVGTGALHGEKERVAAGEEGRSSAGSSGEEEGRLTKIGVMAPGCLRRRDRRPTATPRLARARSFGPTSLRTVCDMGGGAGLVAYLGEGRGGEESRREAVGSCCRASREAVTAAPLGHR
jgi:hypothetical protein